MFRHFNCIGGGGQQTVGSDDDDPSLTGTDSPKREDPPPEIETPSLIGDLSSVSSQTGAVKLQRRQSVEENPHRAEHRSEEGDEVRRGDDPPPLIQRMPEPERTDGVPIVDERISVASPSSGEGPDSRHGAGSRHNSEKQHTSSDGSSSRHYIKASHDLPKLGNEHLLRVSDRVEEYMSPLTMEDTASLSERSSRSSHLHLLEERLSSRDLESNRYNASSSLSDEKSLSSRELEITSAAASSRRSQSGNGNAGAHGPIRSGGGLVRSRLRRRSSSRSI